MQIVDVEHFLAHHDAADPLRLEPISVLEPRREPYHVLLCQPQGTVHASHNRIGNADPAGAAAMYTALLQEAVARQCHLVITPEYSVPWSVVDHIARGPLRPPNGSLWALGFESISPDQLEALRARLAIQGDVRLLYETIDPQQRAHRALSIRWFTSFGQGLRRTSSCSVSLFSSRPSPAETTTMLNYALCTWATRCIALETRGPLSP